MGREVPKFCEFSSIGGGDGALSAFAGCNDYNATYALTDDGGISITGVSTTLKACEEPAMTLESQYLAALDKAAKYEMSGDRLTLLDAGGSTQVSYVAAS
jgi:heat shock protein HslJ